MSFRELGLHRLIVDNLSAMGYHEPRAIQAQAIKPILQGRDLIGLAQTGTGKTCAFAAAICHQLLEDRPQSNAPAGRLRALILCPTRELAQQVQTETAAMIRGTVLRSAVVFGKVGLKPQAEQIARGMDVLVATPGRVLELLEAKALPLGQVRHMVIDEADRMMDVGFLPQVEAIMARMLHARQTMLFTATMPRPVEQLAARFLKQPVRVEIGQHTTAVAHVQQRLLRVADRDKVALMLKLIKEERRRGVLIFCATRRRVGWVGAALKRHGLDVGMIHGDRTQPQRMRALQKFVKGEHDVLVATDVAARGLHIESVRTVINYDLPQQPEEYVHRIGRAGHGGGSGEALTLLDRRYADVWRAIADTCSIELSCEHVPGFVDEPGRRSSHAQQTDATGRDVVGPGGEGRGARRGKRTGPTRRSTRSQREDPLVKRGRIKRRHSRRKPITDDQQPGRGVVK